MSIQQKDPYKNFKFHLRWEGRRVAGFTRARNLEAATDVVEPGHETDPRSSRWLAGHNKHGALTLERGMIQDVDFMRWE